MFEYHIDVEAACQDGDCVLESYIKSPTQLRAGDLLHTEIVDDTFIAVERVVWLNLPTGIAVVTLQAIDFDGTVEDFKDAWEYSFPSTR